ncbi:MAG: spore coat protein CotJB [Ruminococcaceae bacterium]|nr:spore coat protein CotJB [Oscillospiraceae bacterium]
MININSKERLMKAYQAYSFAAYDALLYLNAYPNSKEALDFYNKYQRMAQKAKAEYEAKYGHVTAPIDANSWDWTDGPWPWQMTDEGGSSRPCRM